MTREELLKKKDNLETQKTQLIYQLMVWEECYDNGITYEDMEYAKDKIKPIRDEIDATNAIIAVIDKQLRKGYVN